MPAARQEVAAVVAAFAFTDEEIAALAHAILEARVAAYAFSYRHQAQTMRVSLPQDWQPTQKALDHQADLAWKAARGIAQTYQADLERQANALLAEEKRLRSALVGVVVGLAEWAQDRAEWKSQQIGATETSDSQDDGTQDFLEDALIGLLFEGLTADDYELAVLPDEAAEPFCEDYAGQTFPLEQYSELAGIFPAHPLCPHGVYVIPKE